MELLALAFNATTPKAGNAVRNENAEHGGHPSRTRVASRVNEAARKKTATGPTKDVGGVECIFGAFGNTGHLMRNPVGCTNAFLKTKWPLAATTRGTSTLPDTPHIEILFLRYMQFVVTSFKLRFKPSRMKGLPKVARADSFGERTRCTVAAFTSLILGVTRKTAGVVTTSFTTLSAVGTF